MNRRSFNVIQIATVLIFIAALGYLGWLGYGALPEPTPTPTPTLSFDGERALVLAQTQCDFGPRPAGSPAGVRTGDWIIGQLQDLGWRVEVQESTENTPAPLRNIVARAGTGPVLMLATHYDTRLVSDQDPDPTLRPAPSPGANDSASGVAVLLELARVLERSRLTNQIWLTFFDAGANGGLEGWQPAMGSTLLADSQTDLPAAMIEVHLVGGAEQQFLLEGNSTPALRTQIWNLASALGYGDTFVAQPGQTVADDHVPFLERTVPAVDIIDPDYPFWQTTNDTCDKLAATGLQRVGRVLESYVERGMLQALRSNE